MRVGAHFTVPLPGRGVKEGRLEGQMAVHHTEQANTLQKPPLMRSGTVKLRPRITWTTTLAEGCGDKQACSAGCFEKSIIDRLRTRTLSEGRMR